MKINFYGNSLCSTNNGNKFPTWVDKLVEKYGEAPEFVGIPLCSEERILFNLKKSDNFDIAIIMHGDPFFIFCPTLNKDFYKNSGNQIKNDENYVYYKESLQDKKQKNKYIPIPVSKNVIEKIIDIQLKYFFTPETFKNKFFGSLIQIDQYLNFKKIPAIHCPQHRHDIPNWFEFLSGPVLYDIASMQHKDSEYSCSYNKSANAVTEEGNEIIFQKIDNQIQLILNQNNNQ